MKGKSASGSGVQSGGTTAGLFKRFVEADYAFEFAAGLHASSEENIARVHAGSEGLIGPFMIAASDDSVELFSIWGRISHLAGIDSVGISEQHVYRMALAPGGDHLQDALKVVNFKVTGILGLRAAQG